MVTETELREAVDAAFASTGRGLAPWPDPHGDRRPLDDEYSRLTDPAKWRLVGARADAWLAAVADLGLAAVDPRPRSGGRRRRPRRSPAPTWPCRPPPGHSR